MSDISTYSVRGNDLYQVYGWLIEKGSNDLLKFPKRKDSLSKDWPDQNGKEVDLLTPVFEAKNITLEGYLIAADEAQFWQRYTQLFALFSAPGTFPLYNQELDRAFNVYYVESTALQRLTRIRYRGQQFVAVKLAVTLCEPVPTIFKNHVYLTDKQNRIILTKSNQKIII